MTENFTCVSWRIKVTQTRIILSTDFLKVRDAEMLTVSSLAYLCLNTT